MVAMRLLSMVAMPGRKLSPHPQHARSMRARRAHMERTRNSLLNTTRGCERIPMGALHVTHGRRRGRHHLFGFRPLNGGREARFIIAKSGTNAERDASTEKIRHRRSENCPIGFTMCQQQKTLSGGLRCMPPPTTATATLATTRRHYSTPLPLPRPPSPPPLPPLSSCHHCPHCPHCPHCHFCPSAGGGWRWREAQGGWPISGRAGGAWDVGPGRRVPARAVSLVGARAVGSCDGRGRA